MRVKLVNHQVDSAPLPTAALHVYDVLSRAPGVRESVCVCVCACVCACMCVCVAGATLSVIGVIVLKRSLQHLCRPQPLLLLLLPPLLLLLLC